MKPFHIQFDGRIDMTDGTVVLRSEEYSQIVTDAFRCGHEQANREWKSQECARHNERMAQMKESLLGIPREETRNLLGINERNECQPRNSEVEQ